MMYPIPEELYKISDEIFQFLLTKYEACVEEQEENGTEREAAEGICLLRTFIHTYRDTMGYVRGFVHDKVEEFVENKMKSLISKGV